MFDPKAPIERQMYRDVTNSKVIALAQSPFDTECYLSRNKEGLFFRHDMNGICMSGNTKYNLVTLPERKPLQESYVNWYSGTRSTTPVPHVFLANAVLGRAADCLATVKITFDPNDNSVKSEVVWKP